MSENIKLIATDLDGTLLDSKKRVPAGFEDFVLRHGELRFVIASGRQYFNIIDLFPKAYKNMVFIAENGGLVFDDDEVVYKDPMTPTDVRACIDAFSDPSICSLILCGVKSAYILKSSSEDCFKNSVMYYRKLERVDSFDNIDDDIIKIAIFVEGYVANEFYKTIVPVNDRLDYMLSGNCWIDIANKTVNKGNAISLLLKRFNIGVEESMAFGDYLNDAALLKNCGISYAMANSHPDLKKLADREAPSNDEQGVMQVLEKIFD